MDGSEGASLALIGLQIAAATGFAVMSAAWLRATSPDPTPPARPTAPPPETEAQPEPLGAQDVPTDEVPRPAAPVVAAPVVAAPVVALPVVAGPPIVAPAPEPAGGVFAYFRDALGRSRDALRKGLDSLLGRPLDPAATDELEETLLRADVGLPTTERLLAKVRTLPPGSTGDALRDALSTEMRAILHAVHRPLVVGPAPWVLLVVGVNGSGKTTTIGKLAARLKADGKKVLVAAGDTFRAAAEEQLVRWAERAGVDVLALEEGADPGAVAWKAMERAKEGGHDVVVVDTAGRLQTTRPLMEELAKIRRVIDKAHPGAPHETLLVLDGTMGQNAMSQASLFGKVTPLDGVAVTKLDGTAKGGMILAIASELKLPVKLVGLGEKVGDLRDFDPDAFVAALLGTAAPGERP